MDRIKHTTIYALLALTLSLTACTSDDETESQPAVELLNAEKEVAFAATETSASIKISADCHWEVSAIDNAGWQDFNISPRSGDGNGVLLVSTDQNHSSADRLATITLSTKGGIRQTVTVHQTRSSADLSVSSDAIAFGDTADQQVLTISCNTTWAIAGATGIDWLELGQTSGSEGTIEIPVRVLENFDDISRTALLTVSAGSAGDNKLDIRITQAAKQFITLSTSTSDLPAFAAAGGKQTLTVSCNGAWRAAVPSSTQQWLHIQPSSGNGDAEISVTCDAYSGTTGRMTSIVVTAGSQNPQQRNVKVVQSAN